jgi:glycosyltransferase involved in cell wall biosynthesis
MKILMLGWEYPPHIAGGLGTACAGLTAALARQGVQIHFIVPQMFGDEKVEHMAFSGVCGAIKPSESPKEHAAPVELTPIPAFLKPYWSPQHYRKAVNIALKTQLQHTLDDRSRQALLDGEVFGVQLSGVLSAADVSSSRSVQAQLYAADIFSEVERFTAHVVAKFSLSDFDIIHAHDWMTFPAAVALARITNRPIVVHVHSLEHDRSGVFYDKTIDAIEGFGLRSADRVIAVSHFTRRSIELHHHIPHERVAVVHNGIYPREVVSDYRHRKTWPKNVVLFLGRVTFQKGPDYFIEVATRIIPHIKDIIFVVAGEGDMLPQVVEQVQKLALQEYFLFPGFVQGQELEELFSVADLYVMPSVSEPFGLTALEAISFDTPVVLSKQSGAAEVLQNVLKSDFWDTQRMADLIINALLHSELRDELTAHAKQEIAELHWDAAALKTIDVYREITAQGHALDKREERL